MVKISLSDVRQHHLRANCRAGSVHGRVGAGQQQQLAPESKRTILRLLSRQEALSVFLVYSTVNKELWDALVGHHENPVPCIISDFGSGVPENAVESVSTSAETLSKATHAFNSGDLNAAAKIADSVLLQNPTNTQAAYLIRLIEGNQKAN